MNRDLTIVLLTSCVRSIAISALSVFYGLYLAALGLSEVEIGFLIASGLLGMAVGTLIAARFADSVGRRKSLVILTLVMAGSGLLLALASDKYVLVGASFVGMINGMGRDRGPLQALDQAIVAQCSPGEARTPMFARYTFLMDLGGAVGALFAGIPQSLNEYRIGLTLYAMALVALVPIYSALGSGIESAKNPLSTATFSPETRRRIVRFASLSTLDSLGGGFITRSLLTYWFVQRFTVEQFWIGPLFAAAAIMNSFAYFVAAWLAKRFGLVNTMVFTHIPSSIFLMLVPLAPSFPVAVGLFLAREFFAPMDVPTRQSYLAAVVQEHERSAAAGIVNMTRNASWVVGPTLAGWAMTFSFSAPLYFAGILKIVYDLSLWRAFRKILPPEEIVQRHMKHAADIVNHIDNKPRKRRV
ncbi:MAG TPA: MFS transporter [Bacteroidota bacterium]|nr:MFS transporter [Bacteroidota bacterium]